MAESLLQRTRERVARIASVQGDTCILFCSLGKDSIVLLDLVHPYYRRVICVYMYFVKDLEHINRWIRWVQTTYPHVEFVQVPHWNLTYVLRSGMYCVPDSGVKLMKLRDVVESIRETYGRYPVYLGMKMADGMNRRLMLRGYEGEDYTHQGMCYPLAEWTQKDILAYMRQRRLPEPVRYSLKASNGIGFNIECLLWMRERFPQDLRKFFKAFPFAERELFEYDNRNNNKEE